MKDTLKQITPYFCQNPECNKQIEPRKWKNKPKYCDHTCWSRALEIARGVCARPGCGKPMPPGHSRASGNKFCSDACFRAVVFVPRQACARDGCENLCTHAHQKFCSLGCKEQVIDPRKIGKIGNEVQRMYTRTTGKPPKYAKRAAAVARNNRAAPPRKKMERTGRLYGYPVQYTPENGQYRGEVQEIAGFIARGKTKKDCEQALRKMLHEAHIPVRHWTKSRKAQVKV